MATLLAESEKKHSAAAENTYRLLYLCIQYRLKKKLLWKKKISAPETVDRRKHNLMNHETCCLLALIPQRAHPEIVPLILMTYWQRTAQPVRSKFSQWGVCGVRENSGRKKHTDTFTWNHQSSTLEHGTSAVGPRCQDSYGACSRFANRFALDKYAEIHVVCGELNMRRE